MLTDIARLNDSVNNILKVSRLESKKHEYKKSKGDLTAFIKTLIDEHKHSFEILKLEFDSQNTDAIYVDFNVQLFEMLFLNLFSNSLKYCDSNRPWIKVRVFQENGSANIELTDNGIGIEKKYRKKIFDKFFQVSRSEVTMTKGTGIGLYLVKSIVQMHNGKIRVKSGPTNKGSTFCIMLPQSTVLLARIRS